MADPSLQAAVGSEELRWWRMANISVLTLGLLVLTLFLVRQHQANGELTGFPLDDAYIHLQFAKNLAAGNGLAFLPDRPVAGSTSPLWTALISPGFLVSPEFAGVWAKALGVLFFLFAAVDLMALLRDLGVRREVALLGGALMVLTETLAFSSLSGMEVPLFVLLVVRGTRCFLGERAAESRSLLTPSVWVFAVSVLARPEGLLFLALVLSSRILFLWRTRSVGEPTARDWVAVAGVLSLIILPPALLFWLWNGSPLPTTFAVKAGGSHRLIPSSRDVWRFAEILFRVQPWMTVFAGAGVLSLIRRRQPLLPALWLAGLPLAYSAMNDPEQAVLLGNFGRYGFPLIPFAILLGCLAADDLLLLCRVGKPEGRTFSWGRIFVALALLVICLPSLLATWQGAIRGAIAVQNVEQSDVAAAHWVRENHPEARVGSQDIGALGFFTDNDVVDLVGLINPEILPYVRGEVPNSNVSGLRGMVEFARRSEVDFLLLFPTSYGGLDVLQQVWPGLTVERRFPIDQNVAMAGDELMLLRVPAAP